MSIRYGTKIISGQTEIVDDLTSTSSNKALSANQGRVLKDEIDTVSIDKQDTLIAGDNITIAADGKTISAIVPTKTSDLTNDSDFITSSYHDSTKQNIISDLEEIRSGAEAGSTAIQPDDNISSLTNDANYQTNTQVNTAISTHDTSSTAHSDIRNVLSGKQDQLTAGTNIQINSNTISATDTKYSAGNGLTLTGTTFSANVIDNTTSDSIINALSARVGKVLQEQINNLNARGKYLSVWNCTTGLAMDEPPVDPYTYETGSYFIIGVVGTTNYRPTGATYSSSTPSRVIETESAKPNDTYYYDGTTWRLLATPEVSVAFSTLAGNPEDNVNLKNALDAKTDDNTLATVAKSGSYDDLSNKPTIPAAQVPADWNATTGVARILNKPTIPTVPTNVSEFTNDANYQTGTQINNAISTHNSSASAHSDIRTTVASKSTVSISATGTATDEVKYITVDGVQKKIGSGSEEDNLTIIKNTSDKIQTIGVIDENDSSTAIKTWTGTLAEYQAITTKDVDTIYTITDDISGGTSVYTKAQVDSLLATQMASVNTLFETLYPVGSIYIGTQASCPLSTIIAGSTWELVGQDRSLQGSSITHTAGSTIEAGLPNITGSAYNTTRNAVCSYYPSQTGAFHRVENLGEVAHYISPQSNSSDSNFVLGFDASRSNNIYGKSSTVQPPAYVVNIWKRIA